MSAVFQGNNLQHSSGHAVGQSAMKRYFLTALGLTFCWYNAVHMHDYAVASFVNESTWLVKEIAIRLASPGIAFIEIFVGGVFVYLWRVGNGKVSVPLVAVGVFGVVIALMAVIAGNGSQQVKANVKSSLIDAHNDQVSVIDNQIETARAVLNRDLLRANRLTGDDRSLAKANARIAFNDKTAGLKSRRSGLHGKKPTEVFKNNTTEHFVAITIFSVVCSFGALFLAGYSATFVAPLVAIPVLSLINKIDHPWRSLESDFQAVPHRVSPFGGFWSGLASRVGMGSSKGVEVLAENELSDSRPTEKKTVVEPVAGKAEKNRPHVDNTGEAGKNAAPVRTGKEGAAGKGYRDFEMADYHEIKRMVLVGEIKPTIRPIKYDYLLKNKVCVSDTVRQEKAVWCLDKMHDEGVLVLNDAPEKGGKMKAKYVLAPAAVEPSVEGDEVGPLEFETSCVHCGGLDVNHVLAIEKRKGTVLCSTCNKGYVAKIPDDEYGPAIREARAAESK